jgi:cytochrome P450
VPENEHPRLDSPRFKANPYPVYARLRTEAPVYRTKVAFWLPTIWIVTRGLVILRRASPQDDLITALVRAEESGDRLTEDETWKESAYPAWRSR